MASSRTILLWVFIAVIFCSCKAPASIFSYNKHINADFFSNMPQASDISDCPLDSIVAVQVYVASLSEKLVEKDNLLEFSVLNNSSKMPYVTSIHRGLRQELYLFRFVTSEGVTNAMIYLPVRYGAGGECIGFGSAYMGCLGTSFSATPLTVINFLSELKVRKKGEKFTLIRTNATNLTFFPDNTPDPTNEYVDVKKIIFDSFNKFGGSKAVVFNVSEVFHDPLALRFKFKETIQLKNR